MEVFLTFLSLAILVGTIGGLSLFFMERWLERRKARKVSEAELLEMQEQLEQAPVDHSRSN